MKLSITLLLFIACSANATTYNYLGCNWFIPTSYTQIADNNYRRTTGLEDINVPFSSVLFSEAESDHELQNYIEMNQLQDTEVVVVAHPGHGKQSYRTYYYKRHNRLGFTITTNRFEITQEGLAVSMFSVPDAEGLHITSACVPPTVMEQHYEVLAKLE
ncbi:hypothetical protein [Arsukibacterium indicum]|uniref:Uncharacterized protein n=1 Tax=Arsukibacterium indicum TaxID=2848612 RepID=A0ABS6MNZ2_9GAMM|nr:hypothetical protein [Arsukibacterium indicum]MBV2129992.1 hypothetical protein [Arsukibacterium indicum]